MCQNICLHNNEHGCVSECYKCGHIRVAFGNISLTLTPEEFCHLGKAVQNYYYQKESSTQRQTKSIYLQTPSKQVSIVLTIDELEHFTDLLQASLLTFELNQIFPTQQSQ
jgi:hypothetical protein